MKEKRVIAADESSLGSAFAGGAIGTTEDGAHVVAEVAWAVVCATVVRASARVVIRAMAGSVARRRRRRDAVWRGMASIARSSSHGTESGRHTSVRGIPTLRRPRGSD